jgi:bifunctional UDP-N-acetylglucosamine pyrophosphorylase/glucosamine-1-phosphate N-acetyltransferase
MAGKGERLLPLTATRPKALIPVANTMLLDYVINAVGRYVDGYVFVVNYMQDAIRDYMAEAYPDLDVTYVVQERICGTANAVYAAKGINEPFLCLNGDIYVEEECIRRALELHTATGNQVISVKPMNNDGGYGSVQTADGLLVGILEKSAQEEALVNIGVYVFTPAIFSSIEATPLSPRGEYELTDSIMALKDDFAVSVYEGYWNDIGYPWSLLEVNEHIVSAQACRIDGIVEEHAHISGNVWIGKGTRVRSGAYIVGPVRIGADCDIGPNCFIRPYTTIGNKCHVGNATEIKNSILFSHTNAAHLSYVGDSVIGEQCNLGAGTLVANLRHKKDPVKMEIKGKVISSNRRKLGVVIGDYTKTGINVSIYEGRKIGDHCGIGPGVILDKNVESHTMVLATQQQQVLQRRKD